MTHWIKETLTRSQELEGDLEQDTARGKKLEAASCMQREAACLQVVCTEKTAATYIPLSTLATILDLPLPTLRQSAPMPSMSPPDFH